MIGGGGLVGGAWELGVLSGLRQRGLGRAEFVLGTSIGSIVGAAECAGAPEESVMRPAGALRPALNAYLGRVDPTLMAQIMGRGFGLDAAERATIGQLAARSDSGPEAEFIDRVATLLPGDGAWPPGLAVTGVAIDDGEFVIWDEAFRRAPVAGGRGQLRRSRCLSTGGGRRPTIHRWRNSLADERRPGGRLRARAGHHGSDGRRVHGIAGPRGVVVASGRSKGSRRRA